MKISKKPRLGSRSFAAKKSYFTILSVPRSSYHQYAFLGVSGLSCIFPFRINSYCGIWAKINTVLLGLSLVFVLCFASCSKDKTSKLPEEKEVDVYVTGTEGNFAKLWKNGVATDLTDGTKNARADNVFVVEK